MLSNPKDDQAMKDLFFKFLLLVGWQGFAAILAMTISVGVALHNLNEISKVVTPDNIAKFKVALIDIERLKSDSEAIKTVCNMHEEVSAILSERITALEQQVSER